MNDGCCGISKHIHVEEMWMLCLGISGFSLGMKRIGSPKEKDIPDSSDALSDQVLSLDTAEDDEDRVTRC